MKEKSLELDLQMVMEGMLELALCEYHQCQTNTLRILSIETVEEATLREQAEKSANVVTLEARRQSTQPSQIYRSLQFQDRFSNS